MKYKIGDYLISNVNSEHICRVDEIIPLPWGVYYSLKKIRGSRWCLEWEIAEVISVEAVDRDFDKVTDEETLDEIMVELL